jgi:hypothetical protein
MASLCASCVKYIQVWEATLVAIKVWGRETTYGEIRRDAKILHDVCCNTSLMPIGLVMEVENVGLWI